MIRNRKRPVKVEDDDDDVPPVLEAEAVSAQVPDEVQFQGYVSFLKNFAIDFSNYMFLQ